MPKIFKRLIYAFKCVVEVYVFILPYITSYYVN